MKLRRRIKRVQLDIVCPHGRFIPASYKVGSRGRLACEHCGFTIELSWTRERP